MNFTILFFLLRACLFSNTPEKTTVFHLSSRDGGDRTPERYTSFLQRLEDTKETQLLEKIASTASTAAAAQTGEDPEKAKERARRILGADSPRSPRQSPEKRKLASGDELKGIGLSPRSLENHSISSRPHLAHSRSCSPGPGSLMHPIYSSPAKTQTPPFSFQSSSPKSIVGMGNGRPLPLYKPTASRSFSNLELDAHDGDNSKRPQ